MASRFSLAAGGGGPLSSMEDPAVFMGGSDGAYQFGAQEYREFSGARWREAFQERPVCVERPRTTRSD